MRFRFAAWRLHQLSRLLPLLLPTYLLAQEEAWTGFLTNWRQADHAPVTLMVPKDRLPPAYARSDEPLMLLTATGDLGIQPLEGLVLDSLRQARGWKAGPHWVLLGRDGSLLEEGTDLPKGEYLQSRLRTLGITPTWEALEQFIRFHPDNGSALQRRLSIATGLARRRFLNLRDQGKVETPKVSAVTGLLSLEPAKITDPSLQGEWCREVENTLNRFNQMPDPWRLADKMLFQVWLDFYGQTTSLGLRGELTRLNQSILEAWRRSPHSGSNWLQTWQDEGMGLGAFWMSCDAATRTSSGLPELPSLIPSPGRFWPHSGLLLTALQWPRPDGANGEEILAFLDRLPTEAEAPFLWNDSWSDWLQFRSRVSFRRAMALGSLGRWQEAAMALQECRRLSGKHWAESAAQLLAQISKKDPPGPAGKADIPAKAQPPDVFLEVLRLPSLEEPPPPPRPAPLRLLVWGQPAWIARWAALRATPDLAPWSASELKRESPREADTARLTQAGFPAAGWAVFQGDSKIVIRGDAAPEIARLAMQLRSSAPSRIHLLDDFVTKHPEHLDARRDRYALVKARMPQAALESRLMEDAAKTFFPLDFGPDTPWLSDLKGWQTQARKLVPELESRLRRWPDNAGLWRAWVSWIAFLPKLPSVADFAAGLPVFGPREAWISRLPPQVHRAVAKECRDGRKFGSMLDWFEVAWSGLTSQVQSKDPPQVSEREKAIYEGYREALTALGRTADRAELDRAWASRQPKAKDGPRS